MEVIVELFILKELARFILLMGENLKTRSLLKYFTFLHFLVMYVLIPKFVRVQVARPLERRWEESGWAKFPEGILEVISNIY